MTSLRTIYEATDASPGEKGVFHALKHGNISSGAKYDEDASQCTDAADDIDSDTVDSSAVFRVDSCSDMSMSDAEGNDRQSVTGPGSLIFRKNDFISNKSNVKK